MNLTVAYAGTPEFAAEALEALFAAGYSVPLVLTQPDRPAGRGMKLQASAVKHVALRHGTAVSQPRSLRLDGKYPEDAQAAQLALQQARPDVLVVAAYGLILPRWVLTLPRLGCLNIHASLLPRWRGAAPIHRAIEAGDAQTGITIMQMDEGLDTGAMLRVDIEPIQPDDTTARLHDRLAAQGAQALLAVLAELAHSQGAAPVAVPQPEQGICYAHKIDKAEAPLDWRLPAQTLARRIRAFDPFPRANFSHDGEIIKVWEAHVVPGTHGAAPGQVLALDPRGPVIACGEEALCLSCLQRPGGRRQPAPLSLAGHPLRVGDCLDPI
ncbi:methionyl-tRNA formyltransferase [Leptothrix ochracea]|uniref:methionyl-tRNA formyltransferase n=1 Tax=Leptothrix ochracea TaxID=735331 RepID=UPI0034E1E9A1